MRVRYDNFGICVAMEHLNIMHVSVRVKTMIMRRPTYFTTSITNVTNDIKLIKNYNQRFTTSQRLAYFYFCFIIRPSVFSSLEIFLSMRYINRRFTFLLTYSFIRSIGINIRLHIKAC